LRNNGSFVYTPTAGWFGEDTFTYRVTDGRLQSTPVSVTIQIGSGSVPYALADEKTQS
jgi:hypothetical protein